MAHGKYHLSPEVLKIVNSLYERELFQSNAYIQLANKANSLGFLIAEKYFLKESVEEREHAMGWYDYITGRGSDITVPAIPAPSLGGKSLYELTEEALEMEGEVSTLYSDSASKLMGICQMTYNKILPYLTIQTEALKFYIDACAKLSDLDKTGELIAEEIFA